MTEQDRADFEAWISGPPYERSVDRYPDDPTRYGFPNTYRDHDVDLCWLAWIAARRPQSEQVRELVELLGLPVQTDDLARMDCNDIDAAIEAAQLKETTDE